MEEAGLAFKPLLDMRDEIASLEERLGDESASEHDHAAMQAAGRWHVMHDAVPDGEHEAMLMRYSELQEDFRRLEG